MPSYAAILFDFGGTLDADGAPSVEQFLRAYRAVGGVRSADEFETIFRESDRQLAADPTIRTLGFRDTIAAQSRALAALARDERLDASRLSDLVHREAAATGTRNVRILGALRALGLRLGVVSNFTGNLDRCLADLQLASMLDAIVDSAIVGVRKPDPAIFTLALEQLGVEPSQALMVGDNPFADIRAAAAVGMATCWLAPLTRRIPDGCAPTFRIERLSELLEHFETTPDRSASHRASACTG